MARTNSGRGLAAAYAATVFLSAFLLFQVQPLIGKAILPWFGGSPAVWTTCMLVFQVLLFGGYAYAHLTTQYVSPARQGWLHLALLAVALVLLPVMPDPSWKPTGSDAPVLRIILLTLSTVGLPYLILSSTGPLVQRWFSATHAGRSPYPLYSLSNLGSLLALISYPFVVEPAYSTAAQSQLWSGLFAVFAVLCAASATLVARHRCGRSPDRAIDPDRRYPRTTPGDDESCSETGGDLRSGASAGSGDPRRTGGGDPRRTGVVAGLLTEPQGMTEGLLRFGRPAVAPAAGSGDPRRTGGGDPRRTWGDLRPAEDDGPRPTANLIGLWFGLAMVPSVMLLATTNRVCLDIAVIPFLWIVPLALYLITFILCFDGEKWYSRRFFVVAAGGSLIFVCWMFMHGSAGPSLIWQVTGYFAALFFSCMVCHGELVALRPAPRYLTLFYMTLSAGGAAGGLFVGILAPRLFVSYFELHVGIFAFCFLYLAVILREDWRIRLPLPGWLPGMSIVVLLIGVTALLSQSGRHASGSVDVSRNFYGVLKVEHRPAARPEDEVTQLFHGWVIHGTQFVAPEKRNIPTAYYGRASGAGQALTRHHSGLPRHVGVVGLGVGTLAAYGQPGDRFRFYEINPDVITLAHKHFTFLRDCPAAQTIVTGDARLALEFEEPQQFDVLVLDAFSGDAIPVHLLTREAMEVYLKHLKTDGLLACHISNLHFDLRPVIAGLAQDYGLTSVVRRSEADRDTAAQPALWVLLARYPQVLALAGGLESNSQSPRPPVLWTDGRSNLLEVLWRGEK